MKELSLQDSRCQHIGTRCALFIRTHNGCS